jgi:hypothetical protein
MTKAVTIGSISDKEIADRIYVIRGIKLMLDRDLAEMYDVQVKALNQAVKRNIGRFPNDFMFQLSKEEGENLKSQIVTSSLTQSNPIGFRIPSKNK